MHGPDPSDHADVGPAADDPDEIVETDVIEGGWEAWSVTTPPPRATERRAPRAEPRPAPRGEDPDGLLRRVVTEMMVTWRTDRGLLQRDAASRLGVTQSWLSRVERGRVPIGIDLLARFAAVTGSDVSVRIVPEPCGPPVRRIARAGQVGRATLQVVVTGPEGRSPPADRRPSGPIF